MSDPDTSARSWTRRIDIDWPGLLLLGWSGIFALLYFRMVLERKAPAVWRALGPAMEIARSWLPSTNP